MVKRNKKNLLLTVAIIMSLSIPASAYDLSGRQWTSSTITWNYTGDYTKAKTAFRKAASAWNSDVDGISFSKDTSSYKVTCNDVDTDNVTWDGITTTTYNSSTGNISKAIVKFNRAYEDSWNDTSCLKSIAVHEFGHVLGLDDLDEGTDDAIMNGYTWGDGSRYGDYGLTTPQNDDVDGVNKIYD